MSIIISYLFLVFFIAFVFFGLIPGLGAFWVRSHWRQFRKRIVELSLKPFITYSEVSESSEGLIGEYRFFGSLEAIQGENTIWVKSGDMSVAVNMEDVRVYILPSFSFFSEETEYESPEKILPDEEPQSILWSKISSLPMGTQVFVGGCLFAEKGRGIFKAQENHSLIAVIYDGNKESILKRAIWGGRQSNEYFNQFTVPSLITGSFSLILAAYIMLYNPLLRIPALFAITLSFFPISSMLPPGVILYFFYKRSWKQGRILRAERDLIRLPLRYFPAESRRKEGLRISRFPTGEKCIEISGAVWNREEGIVKSDSKIFKLTEKLPLRSSVHMGLKALKSGGFNIYGKYLEEDDNCYIMKPDDPMAEMVAIPGDPEKLSYRRQKWARFYELLSAFFIFSDLLINLFFVLFILHYYIK